MEHIFYMAAVAQVLVKSEAKRRSVRTMGRTVKLPQGVPFKFMGQPIAGPQCVTVSLAIDDQDLGMVMGLGERFAHRANSQFARVYRDLSVVRVEFTLPPTQWKEVKLGQLPHHRETVTVGQRALGPVARLDWANPHKAVFGSTRTGKTTCLADMCISLVRVHEPEVLRLLILNPKNDPAFEPFNRVPHLMARIGTDYQACADLLRLALAEMEQRRRDAERQKQRLVVMVDEVAQLTEVMPETGPIITQLSQMAGGLRINLVVASQAANPSTFGKTGSLAQANFQSRLVFQLPHSQAYLATNLSEQHPEKLGGSGDGLAISGDRVTRFRAALPGRADYENLPQMEREPDAPRSEELAGDAAASEWQIDPDRLAYALVVRDSATALRSQFGGGTNQARLVRDYAAAVRPRLVYWARQKRLGGAG